MLLFESDRHGTKYHARFVEFMKMAQSRNLVLGGAMTDVKGAALNLMWCINGCRLGMFRHLAAKQLNIRFRLLKH